jgi:hypothetical protein
MSFFMDRKGLQNFYIALDFIWKRMAKSKIGKPLDAYAANVAYLHNQLRTCHYRQRQTQDISLVIFFVYAEG